MALSTFFLEVPLAVQVAFLDAHGIVEAAALAFAEHLELLGQTLPLRIAGPLVSEPWEVLWDRTMTALDSPEPAFKTDVDWSFGGAPQ